MDTRERQANEAQSQPEEPSHEVGEPAERDAAAGSQAPAEAGVHQETEPHGTLPDAHPPASRKVKPPSAPHLGKDEYRLINLGQLADQISTISLHGATCKKALEMALTGEAPISVSGITRDMGLACFIQFLCNGCGKKMRLTTSPYMKLDSFTKHFDINVRAVWGEVASGGGSMKLNEQLGNMGVHGMCGDTFTKLEHEIGEWWAGLLKQEMIEAGIAEREAAVLRKDFHQGVPAITVIGDGGWSKRTHKHSYNAPGGVAILVGAVTGRILHIGVRNRTCIICTRAEGRGCVPAEHECFRNWDQSSAAMENDVILEGFLQAEATHGVRYTRYIGDGDSSVMANLLEHGPSWCQAEKGLTKLECANHVCKGIRGKLEQLVLDKPHFKGAGGLTKGIRVRLTTAIRCAIRMRTEDAKKVGHHQASLRLRADMANSIWHVLGHHGKCSADFCKAQQQKKSEAAAAGETVHEAGDGHQQAPAADELEEDDSSPVDQQADFWTEGTSDAQMEESRQGTVEESAPISALHMEMIASVHQLLQRSINKADSLIGNFTSNLAENWMSIRAKFDGGKMINRCQKSSWNTRCNVAALRKNLGFSWSPIAWERITGQPAPLPMRQLYVRRQKKAEASRRSHDSAEVKARARKRKLVTDSAAASKRAKKSYGCEATDVSEDVTPKTLEELCKKFLQTKVKVSDARREVVEEETRPQSECGLWRHERRMRITASNIHSIVKRNPKLPVAKLVARLLYQGFRGNEHTAHGLAEEQATTLDYVTHMREQEKVEVEVHPCGFKIHANKHWLGATPDGTVHINGKVSGLLEVKNVLHRKQVTFREAVTGKLPSFCLELKDGALQLKRSHQYHLQVQCQLAVWDLPWVDFVVRSTKPYQLHVERIPRDRKLWSQWLWKLEGFYMKAMLPELAAPRHNQMPGIREPQVWYQPPKPTVTDPCTQADSSVPPLPTPPDSMGIPVPATCDAASMEPRQAETDEPTLTDTTQPGTSTDTVREPDAAAHKTKKRVAPSRKSKSKRPTEGKRKGKRKPVPEWDSDEEDESMTFLHKTIYHKWILDEETLETDWFIGEVQEVLDGVDGEPGTVYEVDYRDDGSYRIDHLVEDFLKGDLKFM